MKILDVNNMLDAAIESDMPFEHHVAALEQATTLFAEALAAHLGINSKAATYEYGFGGLCACFYPKTADQECPDVIDEGDKGGDWEIPPSHML